MKKAGGVVAFRLLSAGITSALSRIALVLNRRATGKAQHAVVNQAKADSFYALGTLRPKTRVQWLHFSKPFTVRVARTIQGLEEQYKQQLYLASTATIDPKQVSAHGMAGAATAPAATRIKACI